VGSARRIDGQGIEIRDLSISDPRIEGGAGRMVQIEEIRIECETDLLNLARQQLDVRKITVRRPTLYAAIGEDGQWNLTQLWPLPKFGKQSPQLVIEHGALELAPGARTASRPDRSFAIREVDLTLTVVADPRRAAGVPSPIAIEGTLSGNFVERAEFHGSVDLARDRWQLIGRLTGIRLGNALVESLPGNLAKRMPPVGLFSAQANARFELSRDGARVPVYRFSVSSDLAQGRLDNPRLPDSITDLTAHVRLTNDGCTLHDATARCGPATLQINGRRDGWQASAPVLVAFHAEGIELTRDLAKGLPPAIRRVWQKYQPTGKANLEVKARFDGRRWHPDLLVRFVDTGFLCEKFPYPVQHSTGTLRVQDNKIHFRLVTQAGNQPVDVEGEVIDPGPTATGWAHVWGRDLPVDKRLILALPAGPRKLVRSLQPAGRVHFDWRVRRDDPLAPKPSQQLQLEIVDGAICYDKFPYPLAKVHGFVRWADRKWKLYDFVGQHGSAVATLAGQMEPTGRGRENVLTLRIDAHRVPLDKQLHAALQPEVQQCWDEMAPRGHVDLGIDVRHLSDHPTSDIGVRITPVPATASVRLAAFPYPLKNIRGSFHYLRGQVDWHDARADHGRTKVACNGQFIKQPNGQWHLHLGGLELERLEGDRDLLDALPAELRKVVIELNPRGTINMSGAVDLRGNLGTHVPLACDWNVQFDLYQGQLDCGIQLDKIRGAVRLDGRSTGPQFSTMGELEVDSCNWNGLQFTQVRGPLLVQGERVLLGGWVGKERSQTPRSLTARLYGGIITGDGWAIVGSQPRYALHAALTKGDLSRFVGERTKAHSKLRGKLFGDVILQGRGADLDSLTGTGTAQLRDADLYELPVVVALLKVLSARLPNTTAFTESNAAFRIEGRQIHFDKLDLLGDAVNLYGRGTADFDRNVQLAFHTNFRKSDLPLPIVRDVLGAASQQILQLRVDGSIEDPQIRTQAFPAMNEAIQQLQFDPRQPARQTARQPARRVTDPRTWFGWNRGQVQRR